MRFKNRQQAGQILAQKLKKYAQDNCIVYAIPRGGVPIGAEVASYLHLPLDLVIARKVGHPYEPEYAICAVTETGPVVYSDRYVAELDPHLLNPAIEAARTEARRRRQLYLSSHKQLSLKGKIAIIIDDGIATGLTVRAAVNELLEKQPAQIVLATPVGPAEVVHSLQEVVDEVVVLVSDPHFKGGVGAYYDEFDQTSDREVIDLLAHAEPRNPHPHEPHVE